MVSDVTINSALLGSQQSDASQSALAEDFNDFLSLLTTQLQNQDPLDPLDSSQFTDQLVAFTQAEQQINTNQKLDSLIALGLGDSFSASQSYIGSEVSYVSTEFEHTGAPSRIRYSLPETASLSNIFVLNEAGEVVYSADGIQTAGVHEFVWNGELDGGGIAVPGTYQIRVDALNANEDPIQTTTVVSGIVRGTESQNGQIFLLIGDRAVPLSNILNTSQPINQGAGDALTAALSYVGLNVTYLNNEINFDGTTPEDVLYTLDTDADRAQIIIRDDTGQVVFNESVDTEEGQHLFRWDGRLNDGSIAAAGIYSFEIDALDASDEAVSTSSIADGIVTGVETENGQIFLTFADGTSVSLNNIISADLPENNDTGDA